MILIYVKNTLVFLITKSKLCRVKFWPVKSDIRMNVRII